MWRGVRIRTVSMALAFLFASQGMPAGAQPDGGAGSGMIYSGMMGPGMVGRGMMGNGAAGSGMMGRPAPEAPSNGVNGSGAVVFQNQCAMCHALRAGASGMYGPDLHDLFGRKAGTAPGFASSAAMRNSGVVWDDRTLDAFLAAPQSFIPGNKMPFDGIPDPARRTALIAFLRAAGS